MAEGPTLNSRLRILVAKTFKAEKLYASVRNAQSFRFEGSQSATEIANEIRAREWQDAHGQLRTVLNEVLGYGATQQMIARLLKLRNEFLAEAEKHFQAVEMGIKAINETARRQEFAYVLKLSAELIRHKARGQACKVIADELNAVLDSSGRVQSTIRVFNALDEMNDVPQVEAQATPEELPANVIPLSRAYAVGTRGR